MIPASRAAAISAASGGTTLSSWSTSLPRLSPKPPGSRKSRCMSMTISAVLPAMSGNGDGSAGTSMDSVIRAPRAGVAVMWVGSSVRSIAWFVENLRGELQHGVVGQRGAEQHRAVGPAVGGGAERNRDAEQVEQIAEMGVVAEHRVAVDGRRPAPRRR